MDQPAQVANLTPTVLSLINNRPQALERVAAARKIVQERQAATMSVLRNCLEG
jgi:hypothetical protein